ncbi:MAG: hypothetical protein PHQ23_03120 [Candidatus Wallbacteria bacterium]|nr:hypothetical protein [Candidatus Wallbacteria bacterium]
MGRLTDEDLKGIFDMPPDSVDLVLDIPDEHSSGEIDFHPDTGPIFDTTEIFGPSKTAQSSGKEKSAPSDPFFSKSGSSAAASSKSENDGQEWEPALSGRDDSRREAKEEPKPEKIYDIGIAYRESRAGKMSISDCFEKSVDVIKAESGNVVSWGLIFLLIMGLFGVIIHMSLSEIFPLLVPVFVLIASLSIAPVLTSGYYQFCLHIRDFKDPGFQDFQIGQAYAKELMALGWLSSFYACVGSAPYLFAYAQAISGGPDEVSLFWLAAVPVCLVISGFWAVLFTAKYLFAPLLYIDRKVKFFDALLYSNRIFKKNRHSSFIFVFILTLLNVLAALPFGIGLVLSIPLSTGAIFFAYDEVFGIQSQTFEKN